MTTTGLPAAGDLLRRQDELQAEADAVSADLGLAEVLAAIGDPVRVGSAALGLMVHGDLDITVTCPSLRGPTAGAVAQAGARLALHPRVWQVEFRDDTGAWNTDPDYPDGIYLGLRYRSAAGRDWNADIWFVDQPERQPDLAHLRDLAPRLTPEIRLAILAIKHALKTDPPPGGRVRSYHVYVAVLDDGVRTPGQFAQWRARAAAGS